MLQKVPRCLALAVGVREHAFNYDALCYFCMCRSYLLRDLVCKVGLLYQMRKGCH